MKFLGTALIAILVFGFLIFIHEFGHYIFARIFKVTITEFSIGMGPKLCWYDSKKTGIRYALSAIPFGGYVAMVGEDGESDDPNAFSKKPCWQRLIIIVAGAAINILAGFIAIFIITSSLQSVIGKTEIHSFAKLEEGVSSQEYGLQVGDIITKIEGKKVHIAEEVNYEINRRGYEPIDFTVIRDGKEILIEDIQFITVTESGQTFGVRDFGISVVEKTFANKMAHSFRKSILTLRMTFDSIFDLIRGRYSIDALSGPVGISQALGEAASQKNGTLLNMVAFISINLGIMNLLPLPALDGGRLIMILFEMVTRKKIPSNVEATINAVGLALLLGLSLIITVKDIFGLFTPR